VGSLLVGQRMQTVNALRGHLAEFGLITGKGRENVDKQRSALDQDEEAAGLPTSVRQLTQLCFDQIDDLSRRITELDAQITAASRRSRFAARLQKMPGIDPITSMALAAFAPPMETFRQVRDFSAWLGLVPRQHSSGGKPRLGRTSKSAQRDIRRLLIIGAMAVISGTKARPPAESSWLGRILARKPRMLAAIAFANKMARMLWAMLTKDDEFRGGPLSAA
jgi:transposase